MPKEQVSKIFKHANEQEKETMINLLGLEYWIGGHVHDGKMAFNHFQPIIQVLGHPLTTKNMVQRMIVEEIYLEVIIALDLIETNLFGGGMLSVFCLEAKGKKKLMKKAWVLFKTCVAREYDMGKFETFFQENVNLFPSRVTIRLLSIFKGIGYLFH